MAHSDWIQLFCFIIALTGSIPLFGHYIAAIMLPHSLFSLPILGKLEMMSYRLCGVNPAVEMSWRQYAMALLSFNLWAIAIAFFFQIFQALLPLNPQNLPPIAWSAALHTAVSFVTNTNWQGWAPAGVLSYFTQISVLTVQHFVAASTALAALFVLIRSLQRQATHLLGNFWADIIRSVLYLFLPLSLVFATFLVQQGVVQSLNPHIRLKGVEGHLQTIPMGPIASQVAVKQLTSGGGGTFQTSGAHPFENPTPLTNFFEQLAILLIPAASIYAFGIAVGKKKLGIAILSVMGALWLIAVATALWAELQPNNALQVAKVLEGKETRFGIVDSVLWLVSSSGAANASANATAESFSPIGGGVALFLMLMGDVVFGGVGTGLCLMLAYMLITAFFACLLAGRTAEYLGKKLEKHEIRFILLMIAMPPAVIAITAALSSIYTPIKLNLLNQGPHALTGWFFNAASIVRNVGMGFYSTNFTSTFYELFLAAMMLMGRFTIILPCLALAGSLVQKRRSPFYAASCTEGVVFFWMLFVLILFFSFLLFLPALFLGPIVEHLLMLKGHAF